MSRLSLVGLFVAILVLQSAWVAHTQNAKTPGPLRVEKVKGDLYMISGEGGNVAVDVTNEGVVLVDDMFDRNHADILAQVKSVTDRPLKYVVNTHQHDDHAGGDLKMLPIAEVIAHKNARANLVDIKQPYYEDTPGTPIGLPRVTFSDEFSVYLGAGAQARPPGVNIYVDYAQGGSFFEWTKTLDGALQLDFDAVIPGHGPVSTKSDVVKFRSDLETMRNRLAGLVKEGKSKAEVLNVREADYGWRAKGCPPSPPTAGCLQFQQSDAMMAELKR